MNKNRSVEEIHADLTANATALQHAQADLALYQRLQRAQADVTRLTKEGNDLTAELSKARDREQQDELDRIAKGIRNLHVVVKNAAPNEAAGVHVPCRIEYERYSWDGRENVWTAKVADSFANLDEDVMRYILERKPEALPSIVTKCAPGEPRIAMERYLVARKRGYAKADA